MSADGCELNPLDFFSGGVPTGSMFQLTLNDIARINETSARKSGIDRLRELCFVGALSYFEAFCKDHAASIVSIAPGLIDRLRAGGHDTSIDALKAIELGSYLPAKVGFLVMETVDFGGARKINGVYQTLLKVSPFSKDDARKYEAMLRDRNLIVHHGSVFTTRYLEQTKSGERSNVEDAFMNSLIIDSDRVVEEIGFLSRVASKLVLSTYSALSSHLRESQCSLDQARESALEFMRYLD
ncbi:hypothetical protein [Ensifer adhaerens]|uniref:hypothetical protein n=1 Tax=Ensifer adhaerens TaxID=106592 RepID=UPI000FD951B5|nr:hypothetical protein [Ensifer adhaerens]MDF8359003.1 hypothetical protein [Ensifer adhaerens]THA68369.1 hypothetical protein E5176_05090 [Ensifer adhaerens]